ncbi:MAG TPA: ABC transporter substrate-binding protein [Streptosporangiaceae bacterium]|nr:ABC transporter substrate-binding protein [Streptosporangiaceae bacterium]
MTSRLPARRGTRRPGNISGRRTRRLGTSADRARRLGPAGRPRRLGTVSGGTRLRWLRLAAAVVIAGLATAACSSATAGGGSAGSGGPSGRTGSSSVSQVTLRVGDQSGTGAQALLTAAGLIRKLPFKVGWSDFTSGPPMLQAMGAGAIDIGGVGDAPPVFAAAGGNKIAIVGALRANPLAAALVVQKGSKIQSIAQLRGKRIAVAQGSSANYHLLTVLDEAGLNVHDVTVEYLQPAAALAALTSGHVDAWDIWSPYIEQVTALHGARILVNGNGYGSNYSFEVASRAALGDASKVAAIRDYLSLLTQAHAWARTHLQAWADVWAQATGLPASVMLTATKDAASSAVPITSGVVGSEQRITDAFYAAGLIPTKVNFANFSDGRFNNVLGAS